MLGGKSPDLMQRVQQCQAVSLQNAKPLTGLLRQDLVLVLEVLIILTLRDVKGATYMA